MIKRINIIRQCSVCLAILLLMLTVSMASCDKTSQPASEDTEASAMSDLVFKVRSADRLYTTEYVVHKIVAYDDVLKVQGKVFAQPVDITLPQGARRVLIPMEARIKAYIDFSEFSASNVMIGADSTITVTLPDPKVVLTSTRIDHAGIKTFVDFGRSRFSQAEMSEYERQGREAIIKTIPQLGIIDDARQDAYHLLLPIIESMGYDADKVTVEFSKVMMPDIRLKD